jgi:hypothetical protein
MTVPRTMQAIRLHGPGVDGLRHQTTEIPSPPPGDVLVEVHAAAIPSARRTRLAARSTAGGSVL